MFLLDRDFKNFKTNGYLIKKKFLNTKIFFNTANKLNREISNYIKDINVNNFGGSIIGNLNLFPGKYGRIILRQMKKNKLKNLVFKLLGKDISNFNVKISGNLCMPLGYNQHFHTDGEYNDDMIIINVATSYVTNSSGPTEIIPGSHKKEISYYKFLFSKKKKIKVVLNTGDILIRKHNLWHRGTTNNSEKPRFMIAFMLFDKKRKFISDKIENNDKIIISNNFFENTKAGRIKEYIYCELRFLFIFYKIIRCFFK